MNQETITLQRTGPRVVRVVKAVNTPEYNARRHSLALLRSLVELYPKDAVEYVRQIVLDKRK